MAKIEFKGLEEYQRKLKELSALSEERVIGAAIYDGAKIVADEVRKSIQSLPTDVGHAEKKRGPTIEVRDALLQGMGVSPMESRNGFLNVKIGFDGYDSHPTPKYPNGHPIPMLARSVQNGTSFMYPNPFVKSAVSKSKNPAVAAMKKRIGQEIDKIMK